MGARVVVDDPHGRGGDVENSPKIVWQELGHELWEARLVEPTGLTVYAGYMAQSADADSWRGYIGVDFVFVASGERVEVQRTLEEAARRIWAVQRQAVVRAPTTSNTTDVTGHPNEDGHR